MYYRRIIIIRKGWKKNEDVYKRQAADPLLAPLLISFGLSEFSVSATSILATRKGISLWTKEEADAVAAKAMSMTTEAEVEAYLKTVAKH